MKLTSMLSSGLLAALLTVSLGTQAAADADKATASQAPAASPADKTTKPAAKAGAPQKTAPAATEGKPAKLKADKDRSKHYHPRDGKS